MGGAPSDVWNPAHSWSLWGLDHTCALCLPHGNQGRKQSTSSGAEACEGADYNLVSKAWQPRHSSVSHTQVQAHRRHLLVGLLKESREVRSTHLCPGRVAEKASKITSYYGSLWKLLLLRAPVWTQAGEQPLLSHAVFLSLVLKCPSQP